MIKMLSFNLRVAVCERGTPHAWPLRRGLCLDAIRGSGCDFCGAQEALWAPDDPDVDQGGDLARGLPEYAMLGGPRDEDATRGEGTPILYRRDRWEADAAARGTLWLSETPEVRASRSWDSSCARTLVWARFHELSGGRRTGRSVVFANTHLDYVYEHTALMQAALCDRILAEKAHPGEPVFLTGDFNMYERSWPVRHLLGEDVPGAAVPPAPLPLREAWRDANPGAPDERSFHGWGRATMNRRIDYVFYAGKGVRPASARLRKPPEGGAFPSDHHPLEAEFRIPGPSGEEK